MSKLNAYRALAEEIEEYKSSGHSTDCDIADKALSMAPAILDLLKRLEIAEKALSDAVYNLRGLVNIIEADKEKAKEALEEIRK